MLTLHLDENFEETIKRAKEITFHTLHLVKVRRCVLTLHYYLHGEQLLKMKNSTNTNLLILDEIFDSSLDGTGTDEIHEQQIFLNDENVFVISHKQDALADKFRNTIKFEKIRNFSSIEK